jgi:hypothetical protein
VSAKFIPTSVIFEKIFLGQAFLMLFSIPARSVQAGLRRPDFYRDTFSSLFSVPQIQSAFIFFNIFIEGCIKKGSLKVNLCGEYPESIRIGVKLILSIF